MFQQPNREPPKESALQNAALSRPAPQLGGQVDPHIISLLAELRQEHLLPHLAALPRREREHLQRQIENADWRGLEENIYRPPELTSIAPSRILRRSELGPLEDECRALGQAAYRAGEVAVTVTAGGQGTRLGYHGPKGCYPIGPVSGKTFYQIWAEKVIAASTESGKPIRFLIMTSPATDAETRRTFHAYDYFGMRPDCVHFFVQGSALTTDAHGRALLASPKDLLSNPDGHGGWHTALRSSGLCDSLISWGVKDLLFIQIDNILAPVFDPLAVGLRRREQANVLAKVLRKVDPLEKMGALVQVNGYDAVVEYSDLTTEQAQYRTANGELLFGWGTPNMQVFDVDFLGAVNPRLPYHRSGLKKIKIWNGQEMEHSLGLKHERFLYDLFPQGRVLGMEVERCEEFAPVKNSTGVDSVESAHVLISAEYRRWLACAGVELEVPDDAFVEIGPFYAASCDAFVNRWPRDRAAIVTNARGILLEPKKR